MSGGNDARRHWWLERMSSAALIPLSIWLVYAIASQDLTRLEIFSAWLQQTQNFIALSAFVLIALYHSKLGLGVIIDDYIQGTAMNRLGHRLCQLGLLLALLVAMAGLYHFLPQS